MREDKPSKRGTESRAPASAALAYLINFLNDSAKLTGYLPPKNIEVTEIIDEAGVSGHSVVLPAPRTGWSNDIKDSIENYAKTLTYWRKLLIELDWTAKDVTITFKRPSEEAAEAEEAEHKMPWREKLRGKSYLAVRSAGQHLVNQGFMVREPVQVTMVTLNQSYNGWAIMLKYPGNARDHGAGIMKAYDKWIPLLADIVARTLEIKSEVVPDGPISTMFFTANKGYISSIYDSNKNLRLFVPRKRLGFDMLFFTRSTYKACRALMAKYKKDFNMSRKPMNAWGVSGHSLVMHYKKGAGGKVVDDSYIYSVRLNAEKLMKKFHTLASIRHHVDTRSLVVTFFIGSTDKWMPAQQFTDDVAVVENQRSAEIGAPN